MTSHVTSSRRPAADERNWPAFISASVGQGEARPKRHNFITQSYLRQCDSLSHPGGGNDHPFAWYRGTFDAMKPFLAEIRYVNYLDHDEAGDPAASAYGANYGRLRELKAKYDPENFFQRTSTSARGGCLNSISEEWRRLFVFSTRDRRAGSLHRRRRPARTWSGKTRQGTSQSTRIVRQLDQSGHHGVLRRIEPVWRVRRFFSKFQRELRAGARSGVRRLPSRGASGRSVPAAASCHAMFLDVRPRKLESGFPSCRHPVTVIVC
jgi:Berberine and berberine like